MIFSQTEVWEAVKKIAPNHAFDPFLILAIAEQECSHPNGDIKQFDASVARLEQNFYANRIESKFEYATTTEVLLANSFGIFQMLGISLKERGFFQWFRDNIFDNKMDDPLSMYCVVAAINWHIMNLESMVEYGCRHLKVKRDIALNNPALFSEPDLTRRMLLAYNGGGNRAYDDEVLRRKERLILKKELV